MLPLVFETEDFCLRPYSPEDEARSFELMSDPLTKEFMGKNETDDFLRELFQKVFTIYAKEETDRWFWIWGIYVNEILAGHLELKDTEHTKEDELEVVYIIHPEYRRTRLMTSVLLFLKSKQVEWERKIIATVNPRNEASLGFLEKWGIERKELVKDDPEDYHKIYLR